MANYFDDFIQCIRDLKPTVAVVLGSGQGDVLAELVESASIAFADVPGMPVPSIAGHTGTIVVGSMHGRAVVVFRGRLHYYEGHAWASVGAPVRFAASLGIESILFTNAAGGIHPSLEPGSMMILRDHLIWQRPGSWHGPAPQECTCPAGARPSLYSLPLMDALGNAGRAIGENLHAGVYAALTGPCYETPAEIRALQRCGADAVGMSTAHEVETAHGLGIECAGLSLITNRAAGLDDRALSHSDVLHIAEKARNRIGRLIAEFIRTS